MTRTILAAAAALITAGTLLSPAAQACLSCEYVPEVVREHATSSLAYGRGDAGVSHHEEYVSRPAKKRVAKSERESKPEKIARAPKIDKPAKVAKVEKAARAESVKIAKTEPVEKKTVTVAKSSAESESSSITVASADAKITETVAKETAAKPTDCKKFFASVGMTLTVPCE